MRHEPSIASIPLREGRGAVGGKGSAMLDELLPKPNLLRYKQVNLEGKQALADSTGKAK